MRIGRSCGGTAFVELPLLILIVATFVFGVAFLLPQIGWPAFPLALIVPALIFGGVRLFLARGERK